MNESELAQFCSDLRYVVVDQYQQAFVFKTLRETAQAIGVNYTTISKKLNGDEIGEHPAVNPLFKVNVSYMDKVYRQKIVEMNEFIKRQRHLSLE